MCDGEEQCYDGSDEAAIYCDEGEIPESPEVLCGDDDYVPCDNMEMYHKWDELCDGEIQCDDGSDEDPKYCDTGATTESQEKRDEASGSGSDSCPDDYAECATENECVLVSSLCNGVLDCTDESDEDDKFCEIWGYTESPEKRDDDVCTTVETEEIGEDAEGNILQIITSEGNCKKKRQETNCVCDQIDTETDFDDGTTELSSTDKCTCLTLTPVSLSKRQDGCVTVSVSGKNPDTGEEITDITITCPVKRGLSRLLETTGLCDCEDSTDPLSAGQTTYVETETCDCPVKKHVALKRQNRTAVKKIGKIRAGLKRWH